MKTVKRIEMYLNEDVMTRQGIIQQQFVSHNFSVDQVFELVIQLLTAAHDILTPPELNDRMEDLERALLSLKSYRETERVDPSRLKIHEA